MNQKISLILSLVILVSLSAVDAYAQKRGGRKQRAVIDFDDQLVKGELKKPELSYILQKKQFNFGRLIKLRENFLPEMRKTSEELKRGG
jgi:hypothetical protein